MLISTLQSLWLNHLKIGLIKVVYIKIKVYMYFFSMMTSNYIKTYLSETYSSITSSFWFWNPHPPQEPHQDQQLKLDPPPPPSVMT